jgi:Uncharacterized conserved protein (COG2071)
MRLPVIEGIIKRRILVNFRVSPEVIQPLLPAPFRPKLHRGYAIAGICLIRLEKVRPRGWPAFMGVSSENAAHRVAVEWDEGADVREGVFIPRRDTGSLINHYAGERVFPGRHHYADFTVRDRAGHVGIRVRSSDGKSRVELRAAECVALPAGSVFSCVEEASKFFESACLGFSVTDDPCQLDKLRLIACGWRVRPVAVEIVRSSFFNDQSVFPQGSVAFDHALMMRDVRHEWHDEGRIAIHPTRRITPTSNCGYP